MKSSENHIFLLLLFILITSPLFAQETEITGKVLDASNNDPLEFATVTLVQVKDSTMITGTTVDIEGNFQLRISPGNYLLRFDFLGYETLFRNIILNNEALQLGKILLNEDGEFLEEVTITAAQQLFQSDIDKRTYDVENNVLTEGATASELLNTLPSIQMDEEGSITMRGSGNVLIYINGRPTNMSSEEMESVLAQFPANSIRSVELITNPSARYDAQGVGGIINIILKKNERLGFNGQLNASIGTRDKYQGGFNVNYGTGKVNLYASYNYQFRSLYEKSESLRRSRDPQVSPLLDQDFDTYNDNQSHLVRTGMDYQINDNTTWAVYGQLNRSSRDRLRTYNQRHLDNNRQPDSTFVRTLTEDQSSQNIEVGTTLNMELDTIGQRLYASLSYAHNEQDRIEYFDQRYFDYAGQEVAEKFQDQIYGRPQEAHLWVGQLDYTLPFSENATLEAGLKSTISNYEPSQYFFQLDLSSGNYVENDSITNSFPFDEHVHAAYSIYRNSFGNIGLQLGARAEWTTTQGFDENSQTEFSNDYFDLFPSAYLTYALSEEGEELILNYSRRINRPSWGQFAPFYNAQDLLNTRYGNPLLRPEYTDSYEVGYNNNWKILALSSTLYHRRTSDAMTRIIGLLDNNAAVQLWENVNYRRDTGLEIINQLKFHSNWDATLSGNFFYSEVNARNLDDDFVNSNFTWTINLLSNWIIPEVATLQLMADYRGPIILPQGKIDPVYGVNIGLRKDLFNRQATISLNVSDIFNTRDFRIETNDARFFQTRYFNRETQIATLSFTYRFGGFYQKEEVKEERYTDDPF